MVSVDDGGCETKLLPELVLLVPLTAPAPMSILLSSPWLLYNGGGGAASMLIRLVVLLPLLLSLLPLPLAPSSLLLPPPCNGRTIMPRRPAPPSPYSISAPRVYFFSGLLSNTMLAPTSDVAVLKSACGSGLCIEVVSLLSLLVSTPESLLGLVVMSRVCGRLCACSVRGTLFVSTRVMGGDGVRRVVGGRNGNPTGF